jgi:RHS repeat-associated protein
MTRKTEPAQKAETSFSAPSVTLPKGGGAIRGIGEKFGANPVSGTGSLSVPLATSPGRAGFAPQLSLSYDSGAGNGPFGLGWSLALPAITRKTDKGLPRYADASESDVFLLSGAEDLVPVLEETSPGVWEPPEPELRDGYAITRYRPRIEGLFARIERWTRTSDGDTFWRSISKDNVTTVYGRTGASRIGDPADSGRVFSWLICESWDDKGNAILYRYVAENSSGVDGSQAHERNRTDRTAQRYLKRIFYGNTPSRLVQPDLEQMEWRFEMVFDYGEGHYEELPPDAEGRRFVHGRLDPPQGAAGPVRQDPFSSYRAGFEVRTYRLCRRVLMFHLFPAELGAADTLVRSTRLTYAETPIASFVTAVTQSGYVRQTGEIYLERSLPPLEFTYSEAAVQDEVREVDATSLENLPVGLDGAAYQWVDLDGEGVPGILSDQAGGWFYKRNLSPLSPVTAGRAEACFAPVELVGSKPAPGSLGRGGQQLMDLAGDGRLDLVQLEPPLAGFFERTHENGWDRFVPFASPPNLAWDDPNLKFIDLTGDGHADLLIAGDGLFTWYESLAEAGFGPAAAVRQALDEERGPRLVFADGSQSIYLADMSGDGLTDLVRIRNGEVCYWPNLGYGRFGARVSMDDAPWFDMPDQFDQQRIRLADIDGSGVTDILYLGGDGVRVYFNRSGNGWSAGETLPVFPAVDKLSDVQVVDLLGNGTACLVWSSPLPGAARRPMRYVDLMGGLKPHLLVKTVNNLGAETRVQYAPSTRFYLADKLAGRPWITRLNFPVHVVERVEIWDRISRNRFVTRYAYHHGYFDGTEREFRGFGLVEQWDTEELAALSADGAFPDATNLDEASHVPPVLTRTWFHTGAWLENGTISRQFEDEYFREPGLDDEQRRALLLPDTLLPTGLTPELTADEAREACRSLKGSLLRQEVYALDGSEEATRPYRVSESNFTVRRLQPRGANQHSVFFVHSRETVDFHYERKLFDVLGVQRADPRVSHTLNLDVDDYGNVLLTAAVGYGRRYADPDPALTEDDRKTQKRTLITYARNAYTFPVLEDDAWRAPLPCEARTWELLQLAPAANLPHVTNLFLFGELTDTIDELEEAIAQATPEQRVRYDLPYQDVDAADAMPSEPCRRLIEHVRTLYRHNELTGLLPLGQLQSRALPGDSYELAFTPNLINTVYAGRADDAMLVEGGYVHSEGDANWWIPSGQIFYSPGLNDTSSQELAFAQQHFFLPCRFRDPFGQSTTVSYDIHDLLIQETRDALGNRVTAGERNPAGNFLKNGNDYRILQPKLVMDPNRNRSEVSFDALGMVVGTAVMGKPEENLGDLLDGFEPDLTDASIAAHLNDPFADPHGILGRVTSRLVYDLFAYERTQSDPAPQPAVVYALIRETHDADLQPGQQTKIQHSFSYSDGFGREIQKKIQAEPGPVIEGGSEVSPRWVGSGWTIFNNKGKPVRQYEPFFSATHGFELAKTVGVSPVLFYDPVERVFATLHPNHTYEKVVFDPWRQETWDVNDTVLQPDPKDDPDVADFFRRLAEADYLPTWHAQRQGGALGAQEQAAAVKTAVHAGTPTITYLDTLARTFLAVAHNRFERDGTTVEEKYATRIHFDIEGNQREVLDAKDRVVMRYDYDLLGARIHQASMDAGDRWMLNDVLGKPLRAWDSMDHTFSTGYDVLRRPIKSFLREGAGDEILMQLTVYGETQPGPEANNLRGKVYQVFDGAGVVTTGEYDFKGNLLRTDRQLAMEYKQTLNWSTAVALEPETWTHQTEYDALNRPTALETPHGSVIRPTYNEANRLESLEGNLHGETTSTTFVSDIDYNAKGQRTLIEYGNGARTDYEYDDETFRLIQLKTTRTALPNLLQDLQYTYDPAGNITEIRDDAQQTIYFSNTVVEPHNHYRYDALYRLIEATGREHIGQNASPQVDHDDSPRMNQPHPSDGLAMRNYTERYDYDEVGNILQMIHQAGTAGSWTRRYEYEAGNNRLRSTSLPGDSGNVPLPIRYEHDAHGNMTTMPHLTLMHWNYRDQLQATAQQVVSNGSTPETTYYVYDSGGQRVRKVTDRQAAAGQTPTRKAERIYLSGFEIYREYDGSGRTATLERETLHIMDDKQRIALVENRTQGNDGSPTHLVRHQLGNHLASASLELDGSGQVVSYEEYYPFGSTSYQAVNGQVQVNKRYRYTGKERDEETGLYYHGARYYAPWLGRWITYDPVGLMAGIDGYAYVRGNPIRLIDPTGQADEPSDPASPTASSDDDSFAGESARQVLIRVMGMMQMISLAPGAGLLMSPSWTEGKDPLGAQVEFAAGIAHIPLAIASNVGEGIENVSEGKSGKGAAQLIFSVLDVYLLSKPFRGGPRGKPTVAEKPPTTTTSTSEAATASKQPLSSVESKQVAAKPRSAAPSQQPLAASPPEVRAAPAGETAVKSAGQPSEPSPQAPAPSPKGGQALGGVGDAGGAGRKFYHYTDVDPSTMKGGMYSQSAYTTIGDLTPQQAVTQLGLPRLPKFVLEFADDGKFKPSGRRVVQPNPNRGFTGGAPEYFHYGRPQPMRVISLGKSP